MAPRLPEVRGADVTVSVRPGRYTSAICQLPDGTRYQTPWCPSRWQLIDFIRHKAMKNEGMKVLYLVNATLPESKP